MICVLGATGLAHAQASPPPPPVEGKSAGVGVALGLGGTIVPAIGFGVGLSLDDRDARGKVVAVSLVGGIVLPSLGLVYAGKKKSFGMVPRVLACLTLGLGALMDGLDEDEEAQKWYGAAAGLYVVGAGIDIALTPGAVRDYNARVAAPPTALVPMVTSDGGGVAIAGAW